MLRPQWNGKAASTVGQPVGVSMANGQGMTRVLSWMPLPAGGPIGLGSFSAAIPGSASGSLPGPY